MKYLRSISYLLTFLFLSLSKGIAFYSYSEPFVDNLCYDECCEGSWTLRLECGYTFGKFIGLDKKYGEIALFFAPPLIDVWQPFLDVRGYRLDGGKWASSAGIGVRFWDASLERLWGTNLYYDYRDVRFGSLNRIGLGFESLGECWDVRLNIYLPINSKATTRHKVFDPFDDTVFGTGYFREFQFYGLDAELGGTVWRWYDDLSLYGAIGPYYYYNRCSGHVLGGYARLELDYFQYVTFEGLISRDREFGTHGQVKAMINIPLEEFFAYLGCCSCFSDTFRALLTQPVKRNNVIFTTKNCDLKWHW